MLIIATGYSSNTYQAIQPITIRSVQALSDVVPVLLGQRQQLQHHFSSGWFGIFSLGSSFFKRLIWGWKSAGFDRNRYISNPMIKRKKIYQKTLQISRSKWYLGIRLFQLKSALSGGSWSLIPKINCFWAMMTAFQVFERLAGAGGIFWWVLQWKQGIRPGLLVAVVAQA